MIKGKTARKVADVFVAEARGEISEQEADSKIEELKARQEE